jgi:hypothetical protein
MDRVIIVSGHPGIGKTWFLSYILVERLLRSLPTIVQYAPTDPERVIGASHILFDEHGTRFIHGLTDEPELAENPDIWVLCDRKPLGLAQSTEEHLWYLVIATSPKPANTKAVKKNHHAISIYMALWTWSEIVCTGYAFIDHPLLQSANVK